MQELPPTAKAEPFIANTTQSPKFTESGSLRAVEDAVPNSDKRPLFRKVCGGRERETVTFAMSFAESPRPNVLLLCP